MKKTRVKKPKHLIPTTCCNTACAKPFNMIWRGKGEPTEKNIADMKANSLCTTCVVHASAVGSGEKRRSSFAK